MGKFGAYLLLEIIGKFLHDFAETQPLVIGIRTGIMQQYAGNAPQQLKLAVARMFVRDIYKLL